LDWFYCTTFLIWVQRENIFQEENYYKTSLSKSSPNPPFLSQIKKIIMKQKNSFPVLLKSHLFTALIIKEIIKKILIKKSSKCIKNVRKIKKSYDCLNVGRRLR